MTPGALLAALAALGLAVPPLGELHGAVSAAAKRRCGALSLRLTAYDDGAATRVQLGHGELVVGRFPVLGPPEVWRGAVTAEDCARVARQLASRLPDARRWPRLLPRLAARLGGAGDTALRVAIGRHVLKVRVAEADVQEVGYVAVTRSELLRLATALSGGRVTF